MAKKTGERAQLLDSFDSDDEEQAFSPPAKSKGPPKGAKQNASSEKLQQVKGQVDEVIDVMHQNIEKVLERGNKLEDIDQKTEELANSSRRFSSKAKQLRRQMWWNNMKLQLIVCGVCIFIIAIIAVSIFISQRNS